MNLIWQMNIEAALEFYKRKIALGAVTEEECTAILLEMAKEGWIDSLSETNRSKDKIVEDLQKNFGKVLDLRGEKDASNSTEK